MRPTWVFVTGMYRTGSTTQYLLTERIVQETKNGVGIGYHKESRLAEGEEQTNLRYIVCKVFIYLPETSPYGAQILDDNRLKAMCTVRDPRDIIVSMKERGQDLGKPWSAEHFKDTVTEDLVQWLAQSMQWTALGPKMALTTHFEDMIMNIFREVKRIAAHLDINVTDEHAVKIAKDFSVSSLRRRKRRFWETKKAEDREHPVLPSIPDVKFGTSGHWRTWLSSSEAALVTRCTKTYMKRWGYSK